MSTVRSTLRRVRALGQPPTVRRGVVAAIPEPRQDCTGEVRRTHISKEGLEVVPSRVAAYAGVPLLRVPGRRSLLHVAPAEVDRFFAHAVGESTFSSFGIALTATVGRVAAAQVVQEHSDAIAAVASGNDPSRRLPTGPRIRLGQFDGSHVPVARSWNNRNGCWHTSDCTKGRETK